MERIYLDHAATTYVDDRVADEINIYFKSVFGNPSGVYATGREAKAALEKARRKIASCINAADKSEVYFTACGTESDNWAIKGYALANKDRGNHIVTSSVEHHAVLETCAFLEKNGFEVTYLPVNEYGEVLPETLENAIKENTILASVMYANNEVGTINNIPALAKICHEKGIVFHTDAVQAAGSIPLDVVGSEIDMLSASAHKFYGPKGVGFLYIKKGIVLENLLHGGAQEHNRRAGTENVPYIAGMAKALEIACENMPKETKRLSQLRNFMIEELEKQIPGAVLNGHKTKRLPGNVNMAFLGTEAESMLLNLDMAGIECSSGSACSAGSIEPSHVLVAMGKTKEQAKSSLRFTMGRSTARSQIEKTIKEIISIYGRIMNLSQKLKK